MTKEKEYTEKLYKKIMETRQRLDSKLGQEEVDGVIARYKALHESLWLFEDVFGGEKNE